MPPSREPNRNDHAFQGISTREDQVLSALAYAQALISIQNLEHDNRALRNLIELQAESNANILTRVRNAKILIAHLEKKIRESEQHLIEGRRHLLERQHWWPPRKIPLNLSTNGLFPLPKFESSYNDGTGLKALEDLFVHAIHKMKTWTFQQARCEDSKKNLRHGVLSPVLDQPTIDEYPRTPLYGYGENVNHLFDEEEREEEGEKEELQR